MGDPDGAPFVSPMVAWVTPDPGFHSPAARLPSQPPPRNWLLIGPRLPKTVRALDPSGSARRCRHAS